jgi:hypothetical protein
LILETVTLRPTDEVGHRIQQFVARSLPGTVTKGDPELNRAEPERMNNDLIRGLAAPSIGLSIGTRMAWCEDH